MLSEFTALTVVVMLVIKSISLESESDTTTRRLDLFNRAVRSLWSLQFAALFRKMVAASAVETICSPRWTLFFLGTCSPPQNRHVFRFSFGSRGLPLLGTLTPESRCRKSLRAAVVNRLEPRTCCFGTSADVDALS